MNNTALQLTLSSDSAELEIFGTIGYDFWETDESKQNTIRNITEVLNRLRAAKVSLINVKINSLGGDVNTALSIYDALYDHPASVRVQINGLCASAATIIAMAGGYRSMSANSLFLVHKSMISVREANENELLESLDLVRKIDARVAAVYKNRTLLADEDIDSLMNENNGTGKWLSPDEAFKYGFVHEIYNAPSQLMDKAALQEECRMHNLPELPLPDGETTPTTTTDKNNTFNKIHIMEKYPRISDIVNDGSEENITNEISLDDDKLQMLEEAIDELNLTIETLKLDNMALLEKQTELRQKNDDLEAQLSNYPAQPQAIAPDPAPIHDTMDDYFTTNTYYNKISDELGINL